MTIWYWTKFDFCYSTWQHVCFIRHVGNTECWENFKPNNAGYWKNDVYIGSKCLRVFKYSPINTQLLHNNTKVQRVVHFTQGSCRRYVRFSTKMTWDTSPAVVGGSTDDGFCSVTSVILQSGSIHPLARFVLLYPITRRLLCYLFDCCAEQVDWRGMHMACVWQISGSSQVTQTVFFTCYFQAAAMCCVEVCRSFFPTFSSSIPIAGDRVWKNTPVTH